jgi:S-DNA-T family DNA segregation ATPase FtsK/SpoIIIE
VVNDDILANTTRRVALRVQSQEDSVNVIGVPAASAIGRGQQGRAFVKLGQDEITPVQTAWSTGPVQQAETEPLELRPVVFGLPPAPAQPRRAAADSKETELDALIEAIVAANAQAGYAPPRPVWPEPLGARVDLAGFTSPGETEPAGPAGNAAVPVVGAVQDGQVIFALSDDPEHQEQIPAAWDPRRGNLLLAGIPGSGTSTALAGVALVLGSACPPDELDLLILDMGSRDLAPLAALPHTVGYVGPGPAAKEQQARLVKYVRDELDRRKATPGGHRALFVLIDGLAALREEYQDHDGLELLDRLYRAYADGPAVGMHFAITTSRIRAVPTAIDEVTTQKWLFQLADRRYDYSGFGIGPAQVPPAVPGRCVPVESKLQTHIGTPAVPLADAVSQVCARWGDPRPKQSMVRQLPQRVTVAELAATATAALEREPWRIPVGIRESDLEPAYLDLYDGEHLLIAGPARSGKSTVLLALAEILRGAADSAAVWGLCTRRSPLADSPLLDRVGVGTDDLSALVAAALVHRGNLVLLIDDAEQFADPDQVIAALLAAEAPGLRIAAAGRSEELRNLYSHWTKTVRKSRAGILLQPNPDFDGDLLGARIPRTAPVALTPGRGYACSAGTAALIQAPTPS